MLRVKEGDTVELALTNRKDSKAMHSIDLHAVTGGFGGGEHTQVAPGQTEDHHASRRSTPACTSTTAPRLRWPTTSPPACTA